MKRWIHASEEKELPGGYLTTTKFTAPFIKTDEQKNALEALELSIAEKFRLFDQMCDITEHLTSDPHWMGTITEYPEGYYIQLEGTRSGFQAFVTGDQVIRKPRKLSEKVRIFDVEGRRGQVERMREDRR